MEFVYDSSGLCGFKYNNEEYLYQKNIQGDIIAILNRDGEVIAEYQYDAWGNCEYDLASGIATANPFRYRGYYYDQETGLYFLQTRYYDPEVGRFISQDDVTYLDPEHINGLNLYAYCANNPVMMVDPDGTLPKWLKWLLFGIAAVAAVVLVVAGTVLTGGATTVGFAGFLGSTLSGAGIGFLGSATANLVMQGIQTGWDFDKIDPMSALKAGVIGAAIGALGGMCSYAFGAVAKNIGEMFGHAFSNMTIDGLRVAKGFEYLGGTNMIVSLFSTVGKVGGAVFGTVVANTAMNKMFSRKDSIEGNIKDGFISEIQSAILNGINKFFVWLWS